MGLDKNTLYFDVARNLIKHQWLFTYLFGGASPIVDRTYKEEVLSELLKVENCCDCCTKAHTYYETYATSLRMSRYGYHSHRQKDMNVSYDDLGGYVDSVSKGVHSKLIQKESEYYAPPIRFKQTLGKGMTMSVKLLNYGVEYIELRMFDLNPYMAYGLDLDLMYLTHLMLIYSLISDSPNLSDKMLDRAYENSQRAALKGRNKVTTLETDDGFKSLTELGETLLNELMEIAIILDGGGDLSGPYMSSVTGALEKLWHPKTLVSARIMDELFMKNLSFYELGKQLTTKKEVMV